MSQMIRAWLPTMLIFVLGGAGTVHAESTFSVLAYHEVIDDEKQVRTNDFPAVTTTALVAQFAWLREHDYHVVTIDDVVAAQQGKRALPPRSVLLTFDDGYASVYNRVFPLLKAFNYHAVVAVVGTWLIQLEGAEVVYSKTRVPRSFFVTWPQLREMANSGLVEIASHSFDMHKGITGNPQGNEQPAAVTRYYDAAQQQYENEASYAARVADDLRLNNEIIFAQTGYRPRVMVWPFGAYNAELLRAAQAAGMPITLTLDEGHAHIKNMSTLHRALVVDGAGVPEIVESLEPSSARAPVRMMHVDLDYVYSADAQEQEKNLSALLDRVQQLKINTVYLQAFADADGDGSAVALYFPNRHLPMRADLFNRVAWQLRTRTGVNVYAWMPVMAFRLAATHPAANLRVQSLRNVETPGEYYRLSPFAPAARKVVEEIYEDLAQYSSFQGVLFHDDAYLTDFEDTSAAALEWYRQEWQLPADVAAIRANKNLLADWSARKTVYLADWTDTLLKRVQQWRPRTLSARNLYATVVMQPQAETWFAQSLPVFLQRYDYTAVMAMPYMEGVASPLPWYAELVQRIKAIPNAMDRTVFELQSVDWRGPKKVPSEVMAQHMQELQRLGARNIGYYPDDFILNHPVVETIYPAFSLSKYPYSE